MTNVKNKVNIDVRKNTWVMIEHHVEKGTMLDVKRRINITNSVLAMRVEIIIDLMGRGNGKWLTLE